MKKLVLTLGLFTIVNLVFGSTTIKFGDNVYGNIDFLGEVDEFTFTAEVGEMIFIRMRDAETQVNACFTLLDPNGNIIENPCGDGGIVTVKGYTAELTGTYTILAKDRNDNDTGAYGLALQKLNSPEYAQPIPCTYDNTETLEKTVALMPYALEIQAGDVIYVRMRGVNSSIESELEIFDPAGNLIAHNHKSGLSEISPMTIETAGTYLLMASDYNGNDMGEYGISFQVLNRAECGTPLVCGDNTSTSVQNYAEMDAYSFTAEAGARILTRGRAASTSFESMMRIYGPDGAMLSEVGPLNKLVEIVSEPLPVSGNYQIVYLDSDGNDLSDYGHSFQVLGAGSCGQSLMCAGPSQEGTLPNLAATQAYTFETQGGEVVNMECLAIDPLIDPVISVYNEAGELIEEALSYEFTQLEGMIAAEAGKCLVIIKDFHGNDVGPFDLALISNDLSTEGLPVADVAELPTITSDCGYQVTAPTASDPCEGTIIGQTTSSLFFNTKGEYPITWTYEDAQGNTISQDQLIVIADLTGPSFENDLVFNLDLDANSGATINADELAMYATDACSEIEYIELSQINFDCESIGVNEITVWIGDTEGNQTEASLIVNISDSNGACNQCGDLPDLWYQADIGSPELPGSVCYNATNPTFEVTGNGSDIFGTADQFTFVYTQLCGDGDIIAQVNGISGSAEYALAGIMMRKNLEPGSPYAGLLATNEKGIHYQVRTKNNKYTGFEAHTELAGNWIKLERRGNNIAGYISEDQITWNLACEIKVTLSNCYYVGLAVSSYTTDTYNTGTFDHVSVYNVSNRSPEFYRAPSALATADPCQFKIETRDGTPDCDEAIAEELPEINLYPNPVVDNVVVDTEDFIGKRISVTITNRRGALEFRQTFDAAPYQFNIDVNSLGLSPGYYSITIKERDNQTSQNFVIVDTH